MKLTNRTRGTSFYESFSDLIFGTMAIFVLLFIIMMSQVNPEIVTPEELKELQQENFAQRMQIQKFQKENQDLRAEANQALEQLERALETHPIELVIAIDISSSMTQPLQSLKDAIQKLAVELPRVTDEFRVGIVGYGGNGKRVTFEKRTMDSVGLRELREFLRTLQLVGGYVDVTEAVVNAMNMFDGGQGETRKAFVLIGDVGPYEQRGNQRLIDYSNSPALFSTQYESINYNAVKQFVERYELTSMMAMYTGNSTPPSSDNYQTIVATKPSTVTFFKSMAETAGKRGKYTENPEEMLTMLLLAVLATD